MKLRTLAVCLPILMLATVSVSAAASLPAGSGTTTLPAVNGADLPVAPVYASLGGIHGQSACTATAQCSGYTPASCSGSSTCTAVDQDCNAGQQGYAECDGTKVYCSHVCPSCPCGTCGATRWHETQMCCVTNLHLWYAQQCTTSGWVNTGPTDCLQACNNGGGL